MESEEEKFPGDEEYHPELDVELSDRDQDTEHPDRDKPRKKTRSRSRILKERVLFYEHVFKSEASASVSGEAHDPNPGLNPGILELERRLEEKKRFGSSSSLFPVNLRRTPSREGGRMEDEEQMPPPPLVKKTFSYEQHSIVQSESGLPEREIITPEGIRLVSRRLESSSSHSQRTVLVRSTEGRRTLIRGQDQASIGPGDTGIWNQKSRTSPPPSQSDPVQGARTPSGGTGDHLHSASTTINNRTISTRILKYEFLGVATDRDQNQSSRKPLRSPSSHFSPSPVPPPFSQESSHPSPSSSCSSSDPPRPSHEERKLLVTTTKEEGHFDLQQNGGRSSSSLFSHPSSSSGVASPGEHEHSSFLTPGPPPRPTSSLLSGACGSEDGRSSTGNRVLDWRRQFEDVEEKVNRSMWWRHTPSPGWSEESAEFYSNYSRQIGGGLEVGDPAHLHSYNVKSAKLFGDSYDSHIAERRGNAKVLHFFKICSVIHCEIISRFHCLLL